MSLAPTAVSWYSPAGRRRLVVPVLRVRGEGLASDEASGSPYLHDDRRGEVHTRTRAVAQRQHPLHQAGAVAAAASGEDPRSDHSHGNGRQGLGCSHRQSDPRVDWFVPPSSPAKAPCTSITPVPHRRTPRSPAAERHRELLRHLGVGKGDVFMVPLWIGTTPGARTVFAADRCLATRDASCGAASLAGGRLAALHRTRAVMGYLRGAAGGPAADSRTCDPSKIWLRRPTLPM